MERVVIASQAGSGAHDDAGLDDVHDDDRAGNPRDEEGIADDHVVGAGISNLNVVGREGRGSSVGNGHAVELPLVGQRFAARNRHRGADGEGEILPDVLNDLRGELSVDDGDRVHDREVGAYVIRAGAIVHGEGVEPGVRDGETPVNIPDDVSSVSGAADLTAHGRGGPLIGVRAGPRDSDSEGVRAGGIGRSIAANAAHGAGELVGKILIGG